MYTNFVKISHHFRIMSSENISDVCSLPQQFSDKPSEIGRFTHIQITP